MSRKLQIWFKDETMNYQDFDLDKWRWTLDVNSAWIIITLKDNTKKDTTLYYPLWNVKKAKEIDSNE